MITSDSIVYLDYHLASYLETVRTHQLVEFFLVFTFLGLPLFVILGVILSVAGLLWVRLTIWLAPLFVSVSASLVLIYLGKHSIARSRTSRPEDPLFPTHSFSFPSGHSTIVVSLYGFVGLIFVLESKQTISRLTSLISTLVIVTLVLLSRLFLGVHDLSDVIGGLLVGGLSVTLGLGVYFWQKFSIHNKSESSVTPQDYWKVFF